MKVEVTHCKALHVVLCEYWDECKRNILGALGSTTKYGIKTQRVLLFPPLMLYYTSAFKGQDKRAFGNLCSSSKIGAFINPSLIFEQF